MASGAGSGRMSSMGSHPPFFRRTHLFVLALLAVVYLFTSVFLATPWVQVPLGLLILFVVPGYAIGWFALAARDRWPWTLTFALVVGWSAAINIALGIVLLALHRGLPPLAFGSLATALIGVASATELQRGAPRSTAVGTSSLANAVRMTGYRPAQRVAAYGLLGAIGAVFVVILYLATVFPAATPAISFGITGYGGTSSNLPPAGAVNQTLDIDAVMQNNATAQTLDLEVRSATLGSSPSNYSVIPWSFPLVLGNGTSASLLVYLGSAQSKTIETVFEFPHAGRFVVQFLLATGFGAVLEQATWTVTIGAAD
jgi:hypothetical protein